jgi:Flp pilus assembly protein TadG
MTMKRFIRRCRGLRSERGAALVEFALVVPFLMMIMCATIDFGMAVFTLNNLTAAVREGGRYAAVFPQPGPAANDPLVNQRVYEYIRGMNNTGLTDIQIKALITHTVPDPFTGIITVKITAYPYRPFTPLASLIGLSTIPLNRTAFFRWEFGS